LRGQVLLFATLKKSRGFSGEDWRRRDGETGRKRCATKESFEETFEREG